MTKTNTPDYEHGRFCILISENEFSREDYLSYLEMNDFTESDLSFEDFCIEESRNYVEADLFNIQSCFDYQKDVVVEGYVGAWNGNRYLADNENIYGSVYDAIRACIERMPYFRADWDDGKIEVETADHDGRSHFTIRAKDEDERLKYLYA